MHRNTKKMLRVTVIDIGCLLSWKMILLIKCIFFFIIYISREVGISIA